MFAGISLIYSEPFLNVIYASLQEGGFHKYSVSLYIVLSTIQLTTVGNILRNTNEIYTRIVVMKEENIRMRNK